MKETRSVQLLISAIIGSIYSAILIFIIMVLLGGVFTTNVIGGEALVIGTVALHAILVIMGMIFNWIGYAISKSGFALTSGILYAIAVALNPGTILFLVASIVLSFMGYTKLKVVNTTPTV